MGKIRGFPLNRRMKSICRCISRRILSPPVYRPLDPDSSSRSKPVSTIINWAQKIRSKAKSLVGCSVMSPVAKQMDKNPVMESARPAEVPKGYLAVYVGQKDGEFQRVLVPVIYFNHPLFGQLLREAEEVFGFDHPGAITIPCRISEFEHVQTRIKEGRVTRKLLSWKKSIKA